MVKRRSDRLPKTMQDVDDQKDRLPTGVAGSNVASEKFPSSTLEDIDRAVFRLFDKRLQLEVTQGDTVTKVPVVFAGGERAFVIKRHRPPRDKTGAFLLPILTIKRTSIEQSELGTIPGRGVGQDTGELVIKKKLSERDPGYQALINKLLLKNQENVATSTTSARPGAVASRRAKQTVAFRNELLRPQLNRNIYEITTVSFPHFFTAIYDVIIWTQYQQQMNEVLERLMTSYDAQGNQYAIESTSGMKYVAYVDDDLASEDNFDDYTGAERFVRYRLGLKVPGYLYGSERLGIKHPFRKYLSAPQVSFEINEGVVPAARKSQSSGPANDPDRFLLETEPNDRRGNVIESERESIEHVDEVVLDPFSQRRERRRLQVVSSNAAKGERVYSKRTFRTIDDINT